MKRSFELPAILGYWLIGLAIMAGLPTLKPLSLRCHRDWAMPWGDEKARNTYRDNVQPWRVWYKNCQMADCAGRLGT